MRRCKEAGRRQAGRQAQTGGRGSGGVVVAEDSTPGCRLNHQLALCSVITGGNPVVAVARQLVNDPSAVWGVNTPPPTPST